MKNKDLKILLIGFLIGVVITLVFVRIADELSQEVIILDEELDEYFVPTDNEATDSGIESSMSAVEQFELESF